VRPERFPTRSARSSALLLRQVGPVLGRATLAAADVALALLLMWFASRRGRQIRALRAQSNSRITVPDAGGELLGATAAATAIVLGTALVILLQT
jgi:hypothetical protein